MRDYFHGWRRKLGVVTLGMACVFMAGWVRSFGNPDGYVVSRGRNAVDRVSSKDSAIVVERVHSNGPIQVSLQMLVNFSGPADGIKQYGIIPFDGNKIDWHWRFCGLGVGEYHFLPLYGFRITIWKIQYSSIVIPLTVLSAWLLLSKPRVAKTSVADDK